MSASLFLRELKRLLSLTLAAAIVPGFIYAMIFVLGQTEFSRELPAIGDARGMVLALAVLIAPWILGAASFAPERESGAASFLARLPLPAWKLLLMRSAAILTCLACVHGPVWALAVAWDIPRRALEILLVASAGSLALLAAAVYASLSLKRSLSAFAAGPVLVWSGFWVLVLPWAMFGPRMSEGEVLGGLGLLVVGMVGCLGWAAKAQKPLSGLHPIRFTWRPLVLIFLVNAGAAGAISVADSAHFYVTAGQLFRSRGDVFGVTLTGNRGSRQVVQTERVVLSRGGKVALLPEGHALIGMTENVAFTHCWQVDPQGRLRKAALWRLDDLSWGDPADPPVTPAEVANFDVQRLDRGSSFEGPLGYFGSELLWIGDLPAEARGGWIETANREQWVHPSTWAIRVAVGSTVIARTPAGEFRLFHLEPGSMEQFSDSKVWTDVGSLFPEFAKIEDVALSASGECLLAYGSDAQGLAVAGVDLRASEPVGEVFCRPPSKVVSHWADPATPSELAVYWFANGHESEDKSWDPSPPSPLEEGVLVPLGEGKGYRLVGADLHYGSSEAGSEVDLFD